MITQKYRKINFTNGLPHRLSLSHRRELNFKEKMKEINKFGIEMLKADAVS